MNCSGNRSYRSYRSYRSSARGVYSHCSSELRVHFFFSKPHFGWREVVSHIEAIIPLVSGTLHLHRPCGMTLKQDINSISCRWELTLAEDRMSVRNCPQLVCAGGRHLFLLCWMDGDLFLLFRGRLGDLYSDFELGPYCKVTGRRHRVSPCRSAYFASPWWLLTFRSQKT